MEYCICNKKFLSSKQKELAHFPILRCVSLIILCYCKTSWWMVSQGIVLYLFSKTWIMLLISIIFQLCYFFSRTSIVLFEIILSTGALWLLHVSRYCILLLAILWNKVGTWTYCYTSYHILVTMLKVFSRFLFFFLVKGEHRLQQGKWRSLRTWNFLILETVQPVLTLLCLHDYWTFRPAFLSSISMSPLIFWNFIHI